jgi:hypothetical protein
MMLSRFVANAPCTDPYVQTDSPYDQCLDGDVKILDSRLKFDSTRLFV